MTEKPEPLIEAAVRPLSDNAEQQLAAENLLTSMITMRGGAEEAVARWNELDVGKRRWNWKWWLLILLLAVTAAALWRDGKEAATYADLAGWVAKTFSGLPDGSSKRVAAKLSGEERFLVFGNSDTAGDLAGREDVWRSRSDDPACYASYVESYLNGYGRLPDGFLETARRIDPDNAWFVYLAAAVEGKNCVRPDKGKRSKVEGKWVEVPSSWEILDRTKLGNAASLIREAGKLPKFENYHAENLRRLVNVLPQEDFPGYLDSAACLGQFPLSGAFELRNVREVICAMAWEAGEAGNAEAFYAIAADGEAAIRRCLSSEVSTVLDELIFNILIFNLSKSFADAAEKLGLGGEAARWGKIRNILRDRTAARSSRGFRVDGEIADSNRVAGMFFGVGLTGLVRQVETSPLLTDDDLKPGRMIEHELLSRAFAWAVWGLMGVGAVGFTLYRFRVAPLVRVLAERMEALLKPVDWVWIVAVGVILPFGYVMAINRFTPLGARCFSWFGTFFLLPTWHFLALVILWFRGSILVIRLRLAKRAGFFGFSRPHWTAWVALFLASAFVPVIGWAVIAGVPDSFLVEWVNQLLWGRTDVTQSPWRLRLAMGALVVPLVWLMISGLLALFGGRNGMLREAVVARSMVPVCACAMLVCAGATYIFKSSEKFWFTRDTPMKMDPSVPSWTRYEHQVAQQMRKELREILGFTP